MKYHQNMKPYIEITRPVNVIITFITTLVAILISKESNVPFSVFILAALSASLTAAAGNIINDYFDIEIDKINKPTRPLASGRISKSSALTYYFILNIIAILCSAYINILSFILVIISQLLLYVYSYRFKGKPLIGNIVVASLTGLVFIYGGAATANINSAIIPAIFAFLINLIRELLKDIEDIKGDSALGLNTLPIKYGIKLSRLLVLTLTIILILFTFYPFIFNYYKIEFFIIVMAVVNPVMIYFLKSFYDSRLNNKPQNLDKLSSLLKLNMLFGLFAIYMGK